MFTRPTVCACLALFLLPAMAATDTSTGMAARYGDVQQCMEHALGKKWQKTYQIESTVNRWGVVEATGASIDSAPQAVRITDLRCRRELNVAGQPRP